MRATGIVRRIDDLGRVVIPKKSEGLYVSGNRNRWKFLPEKKGKLY